MLSIKERYVVNKKGEKIGVMLYIKEYQKILKELAKLSEVDYTRRRSEKIYFF